MIDERHEELASLYAFDLLDGAERTQFEAALARDAQLRALVEEFRRTASQLARVAATPPPPALKARVLATLQAQPAAPAEVVPFPARTRSFLPWAVAACFAVGAAWLGERYVATRNEAAALHEKIALAEIAAQSVQQQLEAERIINGRQLQDARQQVAVLNTQVGDAQTRLTDRDRLLAEARDQVADRESQLAAQGRQLADARSQLAARDQQVAQLNQRIDALAGASAEVGRQLGEAKQQVARLSDELKSQTEVAELKITALTSMLKNSPLALAVAVWDPKKQQGVLNVQNLPALPANQDYQLWVVDPQYPNPVDGGVFTVEAASGKARLEFKARQPVNAISAFAVTRERKGGVPKAEGPFVLLGK